jgi:hypothetical protein
VLLAEDSRDDIRLIVRRLEQADYSLQWEQAETAESLKAALTRQEWDLVLADNSMPLFDAPRALAIVQATGRDIPFIVVSGILREETAVAIMRQGAHDYVLKDDLPRLIPAVQRELREAEERRQRRRAEDALRGRKAFFEALAESVLDGIVVVDSQGKKIYQNQRAADLWKFPQSVSDDPEDANQVQFAARLTKQPRLFAEKVAHLYAHTDESSRDEIELNDGTVLDRYSSPVRDKQGNYLGRIWSFRDITVEKQTQERIHEQAALLDETQDAILVLGRDRRFRYCNRSAERFYSLPQRQLLEQEPASLLFGEKPRRFAEVCQMTLERRSCSEEIRHTTPLGARRIVLSRWTLIPREAEQPSSFLIVNTDVTEQKQWEERFLRAQRMESIGILASGIAHDLNNILSPILMASALLRPLAKNNEDLQVVAMVEESARRGSEIIQQLLTFGRGVENQRASLQPGSLLKEVAKVARRTFPKNLEVKYEVPENLWFVRADPTQIYQVLLNLCVNARDAMSSGGTLTFTAENLVADAAYATMNPEAKPGPYVVLQIADTGAGIPTDILDKIFDPFFTTKEPGKGTGLGLSTALGIVKGHGGFIQVDSRAGDGTRFKVYLPALAPSKAAQPSTSGETPVRGHRELVLFVDDEEAIRGVAQCTLEANGYRVVTASDGAEALFTLSRSREPFQAVLTDMVMPVMDGPALIRALSHHAPGLPVVAMSGLAEQERAVSQAGLRVDAFLTKPFSTEELLRTLNDLLSRAAGNTRLTIWPDAVD